MPQIGGTDAALDVVGVNYYWNNQWIHGSLPHRSGRRILNRNVLAEARLHVTYP